MNYLFAPRLEVTVIGVDRLDARRHHVTSDYVERFWLPVIGPSCWALARRLATIDTDAATLVDTDELGRHIGLTGGGRNGPINRTLNRLCGFNWASRSVGSVPDVDGLTVHSYLPSVPPRSVARLPQQLRDAHDLQVAS